MTTNYQQGSLVLRVSIIFFLIAAVIAGYVTVRLWQQQAIPSIGSNPTPTPSPDTTADLLFPDIIINPNVNADRAVINENLVIPLRQYYATRPEHIEQITISAYDNTTYPLEISVVLQNGDTTQHTFIYDLSPWQPSMLDITAPPDELDSDESSDDA